MSNHEIYLLKIGDRAVTFMPETRQLLLKAFNDKDENQHFYFNKQSGHVVPHALHSNKLAGFYTQKEILHGKSVNVIYSGVHKELLHFEVQPFQDVNLLIAKNPADFALTALFTHIILAPVDESRNQKWSFEKPLMFRMQKHTGPMNTIHKVLNANHKEEESSSEDEDFNPNKSESDSSSESEQEEKTQKQAAGKKKKSVVAKKHKEVVESKPKLVRSSNSGKIFNPETYRWVSVDSTVGKRLASAS